MYPLLCLIQMMQSVKLLTYHLVDGPGSDELQAKIQRLTSDLNVRRREDSQYVHDKLLQHFLVTGHLLESNDLVEDNQLDIVVALFDNEFNVARCGCLDGRWSR